jgi:hypothetical protein
MDHTAVIKFVENRFIGSSTHLTARDAAQSSLLGFFDFTNVPWGHSSNTARSGYAFFSGLQSLYTGEHGSVENCCSGS